VVIYHSAQDTLARFIEDNGGTAATRLNVDDEAFWAGHCEMKITGATES
jgi:hypothetical protein